MDLIFTSRHDILGPGSRKEKGYALLQLLRRLLQMYISTSHCSEASHTVTTLRPRRQGNISYSSNVLIWKLGSFSEGKGKKKYKEAKTNSVTKGGNPNAYFIWLLCELNELIHVQYLEQALNKYSINVATTAAVTRAVVLSLWWGHEWIYMFTNLCLYIE